MSSPVSSQADVRSSTSSASGERPGRADLGRGPQKIGGAEFEVVTDRTGNEQVSAAERWLARRMFHGTGAESAAASSAISTYKSPRLARNLAVAMALEQQKRAQNMAVQTQREHKRLMEDW